jgi:predicted dehydrogenase
VTFRGALIGCGFFAQNQVAAWSESDDVQLVAVCDRDAERARAAATAYGVPRAYTDAADLLARERLDFVDIATTSDSHRALVELAAPHCRVVICQKPIADTYADARAMVDAAEAAGAILMIHENFRWQKPYREMARRIAAGEIGRPRFARVSFRHGVDNYVNQPYLKRLERFALMDLGLHLFDLARHLVGEVRTVSCRTQRRNPEVRGEDAFAALLGHADGAVSVLDCSYQSVIHPEPFPQTTAWIEGDEGTLSLTADYRLKRHGRDGSEETSFEPAVPTWGARPWHGIHESVQAFQRHAVEVLSGRAAPQPSGRHNLTTLALALAAYDSMERDATIDMGAWIAAQR